MGDLWILWSEFFGTILDPLTSHSPDIQGIHLQHVPPEAIDCSEVGPHFSHTCAYSLPSYTWLCGCVTVPCGTEADILHLLSVLYFERVSPCSPGCPRIHHADQAGLCLPNAGIRGVHHHAPLSASFLGTESLTEVRQWPIGAFTLCEQVLCLCYIHTVLTDARRWHQSLWRWSYGQLLVVTCVLRTETSPLNHWAITLGPP